MYYFLRVFMNTARMEWIFISFVALFSKVEDSSESK